MLAYREALGGAQTAERGAVLTNLGAALLDLYDRTGERRDLDEAIKVLLICRGHRAALTGAAGALEQLGERAAPPL